MDHESQSLKHSERSYTLTICSLRSTALTQKQLDSAVSFIRSSQTFIEPEKIKAENEKLKAEAESLRSNLEQAKSAEVTPPDTHS